MRIIRVPADKVEGCKLIPASKRPKGFPKLQANALRNTYYRVNVDTPTRLRAMVTIMPDGLYVAWDSCGKCRNRVASCTCTTGLYHCSSIGWIRATYEHDEWPAQKIMDYSDFYDPFMKKSGGSKDEDASRSWGKYKEPIKARVTKKSVVTEEPAAPEGPTLTAKDIETMDGATLLKEATASAEQNIKKARTVIRRRRK
jgi:hypothetical protein